jgi:hypothetical protein
MRSTTAAVAVLLASQVSASAADPNPDRAAQLRKQADGMIKQAEDFATRAARAQGELADSATNAATVSREVADAFESLATAVGIGVGQSTAIHLAEEKLSALRARQTVAVERLNVRQALAGLQPADAVIESLTKATSEADRPLLDALLAARKKAIDAGTALHAAIVPEADFTEIEVQRDEWIRAQNDLQLASLRLGFANDRAQLAASTGADRPAAAAKLAEVAARDEERLAAHEAVLAATLQARLADRSRSTAARAYETTTWMNNTLLTLDQARAWAALASPPREFARDGIWYGLDGLTCLTPEVAEVIAKPKRPLSLNGLTELSPEVAAVLAKREPVDDWSGDLRLNGLKRLSPQAAEALAAHQGNVRLDGLEKLDSVPLAQKLARQKGELRLGLTELSPQIAAELAKHRGDEARNSPSNIFGRVDNAASVLRLDNIASLSPETAEALAAHEGVLVLNGLVSLDSAVAASLAKRTGNAKKNRPGTLVLNGLPAISTEAAAVLAAFPGEIVLKGIREISAETAAALAKHQGRLYLTGLVQPGRETFAALQGHPDVLLPRPPTEVSLAK